MITPFGIPDEPSPGELAISDNQICGVHLTLLKADGSGKAAADPSKIMVGPSLGWPIVMAPLNDGFGLAITEGVEDGLSVLEATGLGVWVAGSAGRMAAVAPTVPGYVEAVTIYAHADAAGQLGAHELARLLDLRNIEVFIQQESVS